MDRIIKIGVSLVSRKMTKKIKGISDEKLKVVLTAIMEMALMTIEVFIDENKDNKTQLKALQPVLFDKGLDVIEKVLELEESN